MTDPAKKSEVKGNEVGASLDTSQPKEGILNSVLDELRAQSRGDNLTQPGASNTGPEKSAEYRTEVPKAGQDPQVPEADRATSEERTKYSTQARDGSYAKNSDAGLQPGSGTIVESPPAAEKGAVAVRQPHETGGSTNSELLRNKSGEGVPSGLEQKPQVKSGEPPLAPEAKAEAGTGAAKPLAGNPLGGAELGGDKALPKPGELAVQNQPKATSGPGAETGADRIPPGGDRSGHKQGEAVIEGSSRANEIGPSTHYVENSQFDRGSVNRDMRGEPAKSGDSAIGDGRSLAPERLPVQSTGEKVTLHGSTAQGNAGQFDNRQAVPLEGDPFKPANNALGLSHFERKAEFQLGESADHSGEKGGLKSSKTLEPGSVSGEIKGAGKSIVEPLNDIRVQNSKGNSSIHGERGHNVGIESGGHASGLAPSGKVRSGEVIDNVSSSEIEPGGKGVKSGARIDVKNDGNGKRIELNGEEILVWDGKNSPLYPNYKGRRVSRFIEPRGTSGGRGEFAGPRGQGQGKFGDPRATIDPKERAHIEKVVKATDRIFFGEKNPKNSPKGKGDSRSNRAGRFEEGADKSDSRTGDVRSGKLVTKSSKGTRIGSDRGITGDTGSGKVSGKRGGLLAGELPTHIPLPILQDFKIRWPLGKRGAEEGRQGRPDKAGAKGSRFVSENISGKGDRTTPARIVDRKLPNPKSIEASARSVEKSFSTLLPESRVKLIRGIEGSRDFVPSRVTVGKRVSADATFVPSSVLIQPLDWGSLRGWSALHGILGGGKETKSAGARKSGSDIGTGRGDTATVKTGTKMSVGETATVKTGPKSSVGDTATVKAEKGDGNSPKPGAGKRSSESVEAGGKSKAEKAKPVQKADAGDKAVVGSSSLKESKDAFAGKLPSIKMTYEQKTGKSISENQSQAKAFSDLQNQITRQGPKGGIPLPETNSTRPTAERQPLQSPDFDLNASKASKVESDNAKGRVEGDKGKVSIEAREGRLILRDLLVRGTLKGGFSRSLDQRLDGARVIEGANLISIYIGMQQARGASIREVLAGLRYATPRRSFTPEITESGSYKVMRGHSSQQMIAFGSSAKHVAINYQLEKSEESISTDSRFDSEHSANSSDTAEDTNNFLRESSSNSASLSEEPRKWYIVQEGDTPEYIAVVKLNDESLAPLIYEINKPLFEQLYDIYKQEHVNTLPAGTMILLPNATDIKSFKEVD